jgi:hypothetical protein
MAKGTGFGKALPKNFRKQKRGGDKEFTLQKGVSAAPIKQATSYKPKIKLSKTDAFLAGTAVGVGATKAISNKKSKRPKGGWTPGV